MKGLGVADIILDIKILRNSDGLDLIQSHYIENVIERFKGFGIKNANNHFLPHLTLRKNTGNSIKQLKYSQVISNVMYIMNCIRPDIAYSVSKLSRYTNNLGHKHWNVLMRVFEYLKRKKDYLLQYGKYPVVLEGYCDANEIN